MTTHALHGQGDGRAPSPAARYLGRLDVARLTVLRVDASGSARPLSPRLDLRNHSPTGFNWGYGGSGSAQLALAILADALGDELAQRHYQEFKWAFVARLERDKPWEISREQIDGWLKQQAPR